MTDTMRSQNIDLFSWDILYKEDSLQFSVWVCYTWQMELNVDGHLSIVKACTYIKKSKVEMHLHSHASSMVLS
jgi:hypothetical protein